jgi:hypothetical protein
MPVRGRPRRAPSAPRPEHLRVEPLADRLAPSANPTAVDDTYSTDAGMTLAVAPAGVLANDLSPAGLAVTAVLTKAPRGGALTLKADGSFAYTPDSGFAGTDLFRYKAFAPDGDSNNAHVFILVGVAAVTPTAVDDAYTTPEDQPLTVPAADGVLANDILPNGSNLTAALQTGPAHGTIALNPDGSFTYTPAADFNGTDSFAYLVTDGGTSIVGTASIVVAPVNDQPVAAGDQYTSPEDKPLAGASVLDNDADPDGDPLTAGLVTGPAHGTLTLNADGTFRYVPAAGYFGTDSFTYVAQDPLGAESAPATVTIAVTRVNHRPTAAVDRYTTPQDAALKVPAGGVLANDADRDGDRLTAMLVAGPAHGTLILRANGSFIYVPDPGFTGTDRFTYRASDGSLSSKAVRVTIRVVPTPPQPPPQPPPVPTPTGGGSRPPTSGSGGTPTGPTVVAADPVLPAPPTLVDFPATFSNFGPAGYGATVPGAPAPLPPAVPTPSVVVPSLPPPPAVPFIPPPVSAEPSPPVVRVPALPAVPDLPVVPPVPQLRPDNPVFGGLDELSHDVGQVKAVPTVTGTVVGTGVVATAGYVLLSPRLAYWLLSALLARRTVWKPFDPLEVVYAWEREKGLGGDDDDSLDKMVDSDTAEPKA